MTRRPDHISPTAHYTGYTWFAHGLSHPALVTPQGRVLHGALRPVHRLATLAGLPTLQSFLLARHRIIDHLLEQAIAQGRISQVIEVAAGLSPRGWRFKQRHGDRLHYVEADLPAMVERKRDLLARAGLLTAGHAFCGVDALRDEGPLSLGNLAASLDPKRGTAIVTEGLLNYFDTRTVEAMWARFARVLSAFPQGLYLSDIHLAPGNEGLGVRAFMAVLSAFVRGRVFLHFGSEAAAVQALREAGLPQVALHSPRDFASALQLDLAPGIDAVRIIAASLSPDTGRPTSAPT
jgi:O-methyltransferase involved in polyketide biosynthesis